MMNDMLYSFTNAYAVAEEMEQLKLLSAVNDGYQHLTEEKMNFLQIASGLKSRMREYSVSNTRSSNG